MSDFEGERLRVPDRFEALEIDDADVLRGVIVPVDASLTAVDARFADIYRTGRGGLLILKGISGAGKTTFANTIALFRERVATISIDGTTDISTALSNLPTSETPRIVVISGREALGEVSRPEIEQYLHAINTFVRSASGRSSLVLWPVNMQGLADILKETATELGGDALLGLDNQVHVFTGPAKDKFTAIAEQTIGALNEGASLANLGITEDRANEIAERSDTIGSFLLRIGSQLAENIAAVQGLLPAEQLHVWTIVIAGNDPEGSVNAVTRGRYAFVDIDRMMTSTEANIVADLQKNAAKLGILGTVLDARVIHLDIRTALAVARAYGDDKLKALMVAQGMSIDADTTAKTKIKESVLGRLIAGSTLGTGRRGPKPGSNTIAAFEKLALIASKDDGAINRAFGTALKDAGLISDFATERDFGKDRKYFSDLYVERDSRDPIRLEFMWRSKTGTAQVSNYVLKKLESYGKAVGLLD